MKWKAAQILSADPGTIYPRMQRSFVDRQYSPSIGMDLSEWEIILDEHIRMGILQRKNPIVTEPDSDCIE
jgi:hypothetical protein